MNAPLIVAGALGLVGAAIHGIGGELLVVRKLSLGTLPSSRFGGPRMTKRMIHAAWHMTTFTFVTVGLAMLLAGSVVDGDAARGIAVVGAVACTGFAAVAIGMGAGQLRRPQTLLRHPAPVLLTAIAALAWWGAL